MNENATARMNTSARPKTASYSIENFKSQMGEQLELSSAEVKRLKKQLKRDIQEWTEATAPLQQRLEEYLALAEGYSISDEEPPFRGAYMSNVAIVQIYISVCTSIQIRSILSADTIWYAQVAPEYDNIAGDLEDVDEMLNYNARTQWNVEPMIKEATYCANRDGLSGLDVPMVWDQEHVKDTVFIHNEQDFLEEFPDAESAGMSAEKYQEFAQEVLSIASEEMPAEVPIEFDKTVYFGPKCYLVERANLVTFPANARSLEREDCRGYGYRFTVRRGEIVRNMNNGIWHKEATAAFLKKTKGNSDEQIDYERSKDEISGIETGDTSDTHELYALTYWFSRETDGTEEKISVVYSEKQNIILSRKSYIYRINTLALFRTDKKANQIDGRAIPEKLYEMWREINHMHSQRVQNRDITNVPSFKGRKSALGGEGGFDPEEEANEWHPGVVFWLTNPDDFDQFRVQPVDLGESLNEERNDLAYATQIIGVDPALFSGTPSQSDPTAPGNKTGLLVQQSNLRMDDPIDQLRDGVEQVGNICLSHLYQFGPPELVFFVQNGKQMEKKTIRKRILRAGVTVKMRAVGVTMNPDYEFQKGMQEHSALLQMEPLIAQDDMRRVKDLRRVLRKARYPNYEEILPSDAEIQQIVASKQQQAQQMMAMQQQQIAADQKNKQVDAAVKVSKAQTDAEKARADVAAKKVEVAQGIAEIFRGGKNEPGK